MNSPIASLALPPLPEPTTFVVATNSDGMAGGIHAYTAEQMHDYARAALAQLGTGLGAGAQADSGADSGHFARAVQSDGSTGEAPGWRPIETAPKGRKVLAGYWNCAQKWRTVTACYYLPQTLELSDPYDNDDGFAPEGWYEESESLETIQFTEEPPTHWMPLPPAPATLAAVEGKEKTR